MLVFPTVEDELGESEDSGITKLPRDQALPHASRPRRFAGADRALVTVGLGAELQHCRLWWTHAFDALAVNHRHAQFFADHHGTNEVRRVGLVIIGCKPHRAAHGLELA